MKIKSDSKIAIYGGSFNPVHIGHLITGLDVIKNLGYEYVIYIPANIPVHKDTKNIINGNHRLKMLKMAVKDFKQFVVSDIEIKRGNKSYTIDTVKELYNKFNINTKFGIIIGDDLLGDLKYWKNIDELNKIVQFICLSRHNRSKKKMDFNIKYVNNRIIDISSTEIRERINNNLPIDYLVLPSVKKYIMKKKLYKDN
jgi:nicotinate-nucleotide adenylyltransferase